MLATAVPGGYNSGMNCFAGTAPAPAPAPAFTPSRGADRGAIQYYLLWLGAHVPLDETHPADDPHADGFIQALWVQAETGALNDADAPGAQTFAGPDDAWVADEAAKRTAFTLLTLTFGFEFAEQAARALKPGAVTE